MICTWIQSPFQAKRRHSRMLFHSWNKMLCLSKPKPLGVRERTVLFLGLKWSVHTKISIQKRLISSTSSIKKKRNCKWNHDVILFCLMGPYEQVKSQAVLSTFKLLTGMTGGFVFPIQMNPFSSPRTFVQTELFSSECPILLQLLVSCKRNVVLFWSTFTISLLSCSQRKIINC